LKTVFIVIKHIRTLIRVKTRDFLIKRELLLKKNVFVGRGVIIDPEYYWLISIGRNSALTSGVTILAYDGSTSNFGGYTKVGKVSIGDNTFIGVKSIILPGVKIGDNAIIGAGSVVTKDIPNGSIAAGNPASVIGSTSEYFRKHNENVNLQRNVFERGWRSKKV
jgi:maltose O-acetyltransferase